MLKVSLDGGKSWVGVDGIMLELQTESRDLTVVVDNEKALVERWQREEPCVFMASTTIEWDSVGV